MKNNASKIDGLKNLNNISNISEIKKDISNT